MQITNTKTLGSNRLPHVFCYAPAGYGKTSAIETLVGAAPLVLTSDHAGLLPLAGHEIETAILENASDLSSAYRCAVEHASEDVWVVVDDLTEIAEIVLADELEKTDHGMKAYGEMANKVIGFIRALRKLPCGLYVTAHQSEVRDEGTGRLKFGPGLPGQKMAQRIPHLFDEVFTIRIGEDAEGNERRVFQTSADERHYCKDRSGALEKAEPINLANIASKIARKFSA